MKKIIIESDIGKLAGLAQEALKSSSGAEVAALLAGTADTRH